MYDVTGTKAETSEVRSLLLTESKKPQYHSPSKAEDIGSSVSELVDINASPLPGGNIQTPDNSHHLSDTNDKVAFNNDSNTQKFVNTTVPSRSTSQSTSTNVPDSDNSDAPVNKTDVNISVNETLDGSEEHSGDHMKSSVTYIRINNLFKMSGNHSESETIVSSSVVTNIPNITELPSKQVQTFEEDKTADSLTANHIINEGETSTCNRLVDSSDNLRYNLAASDQPNETFEHLSSGLREDKTIEPSFNYPSETKDYQSDDISTTNHVTDQYGLDTFTEGKDTPDELVKNHLFSDQQTEVNAFQMSPFSQTGDYNTVAHKNFDALTVGNDNSLNAQSLSQSKVESLTDPKINNNGKQSNTECVNVLISGKEQSVDSGTNRFNIMGSFLPKQAEAAESTVIFTNFATKEELENAHSSAVSEISSQQPPTFNEPFPDRNTTDDHTESNTSRSSSLKTHDYRSPEEDALVTEIYYNTDEMASSSGSQVAAKNVEDDFIKSSRNLHFVTFDSFKNAETTVKPQQAITNSTAANFSSIISPITVDAAQYSVALVNIPVNEDDTFENVPLVSEISPLIGRLEQSDILTSSMPHTSYFPVLNLSEFEDKDSTSKPETLPGEKANNVRADHQKTLGHESPIKSGEAQSEIHIFTSYGKETSDREDSVDSCLVNPVKICALYESNDGRPQENVNNDGDTLLSYKAKPSSLTDKNNTTVDSDNSDNIVTDFKGSQSTPPLSWISERSDYSNMTYSPTVYLCNSETSLEISPSLINSSSQLESDTNMTDNTARWLNHSLNGVEFGEQTVRSILVDNNTEDDRKTLAIFSPLQTLSQSSSTEEKAVADEEDSSTAQIYVDDKYILQLSQRSRISDHVSKSETDENANGSICHKRFIFTGYAYNMLTSFFHL
uniref:Uncharacterized protein n=1 Tax=Trichobilharzia regenti TaxID=157069 RepID=A0AA85J8C2_TRIRE